MSRRYTRCTNNITTGCANRTNSSCAEFVMQMLDTVLQQQGGADDEPRDGS
jgi:hypothetical protein